MYNTVKSGLAFRGINPLYTLSVRTSDHQPTYMTLWDVVYVHIFLGAHHPIHAATCNDVCV